ncbi:MAG: zf-HC2 domain-containing protein [Acidimicrobiia bacterium]
MSSGCDHAIDYIYQYLDDEISVVHSSRIKLHLRRCALCMSAYEFETKLKSVIRERGRTQPPPQLFDTLRAILQEQSE